MKRKHNGRQGLSGDARSWLDGKPSSFFEFKDADDLLSLWLEHGDDGTFYRCGMTHPISREQLTANENAWLASGSYDEYGANSHFIATYYNIADKQSLWSKRGGHESFLWESGMRRPVSIGAPG